MQKSQLYNTDLHNLNSKKSQKNEKSRNKVRCSVKYKVPEDKSEKKEDKRDLVVLNFESKRCFKSKNKKIKRDKTAKLDHTKLKNTVTS